MYRAGDDVNLKVHVQISQVLFILYTEALYPNSLILNFERNALCIGFHINRIMCITLSHEKLY